MIRILHVFGRMDRGGAETMIMNLYRHIDREQVQFDFVVHTADRCDFDDEIESLGGRVFHISRFSPKAMLRYKREWKQLLQAHPEWLIVHGHMRSTAAIYLRAAKKLHRVTIAHSHSISSGVGFQAIVKNMLQVPIRFTADWLLACSDEAGRWLFGKKAVRSPRYFFFPNSIDTEKFRFSPEKRASIREELGVTDEVVIGHVGRFEYPKNHRFLLELFHEMCKASNKYKLLLVGDGSLRTEMEQFVKDNGLTDKVVFLGLQKDVHPYLCAFDCMVFPSHFEGFPVSLVEAQTAGLSVVVSSAAMHPELRLTDLIVSIELEDGMGKWCRVVEERAAFIINREQYSRLVAQQGFDVSDSAKKLEQFYYRVVKE